MTTDLEAQYADLELKRRTLKERLLHIEAAQTQLALDILDAWERAGKTKATINGLTLYVQHTTYYGAKDGDKGRLVAALEANGLHDLVTYNSQSLSGYVRELLAQALELPDNLADALTETERFNLRVRKA